MKDRKTRHRQTAFSHRAQVCAQVAEVDGARLAELSGFVFRQMTFYEVCVGRRTITILNHWYFNDEH